MEDFSKNQHSVYRLCYHIVFVTKYRKKVISSDMAALMKRKAQTLLEGFGGSLVEMESDPDHVHLLISLSPQDAPSKIVNILKTQMSRAVRSHFKEGVEQYLYGKAFWSPSYFISTAGGTTIETLKKYIQSQPTEEHKRKYVKSGKYKRK